MLGQEGDWIIRGVKGELYPCKPDIFAATYEAVEEAPYSPNDRAEVEALLHASRSKCFALENALAAHRASAKKVMECDCSNSTMCSDCLFELETHGGMDEDCECRSDADEPVKGCPVHGGA